MAIWCVTTTRFPAAGVCELAVGKVVKGKQHLQGNSVVLILSEKH